MQNEEGFGKMRTAVERGRVKDLTDGGKLVLIYYSSMFD